MRRRACRGVVKDWQDEHLLIALTAVVLSQRMIRRPLLKDSYYESNA